MPDFATQVIENKSIYYRGPDLSLGPMPALIYFWATAKSSLDEDPFNQVVVALKDEPVRIFSWNLPFHEEGMDYKEAIAQWAHLGNQSSAFFNQFLEACQHYIDFLIQHDWVHANALAVAGLSRGAFLATHLAAKDQRIKQVLGFAPLTGFKHLEEFTSLKSSEIHRLALTEVADQLIHTKIRFYMGNHDTRVGTDSCFEFIKTLVDTAYSKGIRSPAVELILYPSIGHRGHGTPPEIFAAGAQWIKTSLL